MKSFAHYLMVSGLLVSLICSSHALAQTCDSGVAASNPTSAYLVTVSTTTDLRTGLMWDQCPWGQGGANCSSGVASSFTWQGALALPATANAAAYKGYTDWRLPNIKELRSLVEECRSNPSINELVFPATPASIFWSGSPDGSPNLAWVVFFYNGMPTNGNGIRGDSSLVRLVRAGQ